MEATDLGMAADNISPQEAEAVPEMANGDAAPLHLSRGQKKKLRQRANAALKPVACVVAETRTRVKRQRSPSSSSSPSLSRSSSCSESAFWENECEHEDEDSTGHRAGAWAPLGSLPPEWPSAEAELLSQHQSEALPPLVGQYLRLALLPYPQPKDQLQWRILPLIRNALALDEVNGECTLAEVVRYVEDHLPRVCLLRITSARLRALVELVVKRNVRFGRLRQHGKLISLAHAENPQLLVPHLTGTRLEVIWVAWCSELKRPMEVALRYMPLESNAFLPFWLCAQLGDGRRHDRRVGAERMEIGEVSVECHGPSSWMSWTGATQSGTSWSFLPPPGMPEDAAVEFVRQVIEQDVAAASAAAL